MSSSSDPASVAGAVEGARSHLLSLQREDGHWCGELEADSVLESEYIVLLHFLGRSDGEDARKAAEEIRRRQNPDGAWSIYPQGPDDVSASVKAYLSLKLAGDDPDAPHMRRARRTILEEGGIEATNTYTKIYLALLGQYEWGRCPAIPPEMVLLPDDFYFNLSSISSWSRGIFVPLSVVWAYRPVRPVPPHAEVDELRAGGRGRAGGSGRDDEGAVGGHARSNGRGSLDLPGPSGKWKARAEDAGEQAIVQFWQRFFHATDRFLKALERRGVTPFRERALQAAEDWILERIEDSDGLGAIFPAIVNAVMALRLRGYGEDHPAVSSQLEALEKMTIREEETLRIQPALSPVWDTAQAMVALREAGVPGDHPSLLEGAEWLLEREVRRPGDWAANDVDAEPSGWYFEYANAFYPDCDDTAEVLQALGAVEAPDPELRRRIRRARERGLSWLLAMQNEDGGWAAFDRGCGHNVALTCVPFADHNAMLDPSCADITGRVLELLADEGFGRTDGPVERAVEFLRREQLEDGSWYGRWGCNYIYGTCFALRGLAAVGEDMNRPRYRRAAAWLKSAQNEDGGWGEPLGTYTDPSLKGEGPSTAAQTAWAVLGLDAAGEASSPELRRGVEYLLRTRDEDGSWTDRWWTGTGFPEVFYLRYDYYDDYFPLLALSACREDAGPVAARARAGGRPARRTRSTTSRAPSSQRRGER